MKFKTHEELTAYILETYLEFGKYSIHDKSMHDAFELGVEDFEDFEDAVKLLVEAMNHPNEHLRAYDYAYVGAAVKAPFEKRIMEMSDPEYDAWSEQIQSLCDGKDDLFVYLTEV